MIALDRDESLFQAAQHGDVAEMRRLLEAGADVDARFDGATPVLVAAIQAESYDAVRLLLERGANPRAADEVGDAYLRQAFHDEPRLKRLLLRYRRNR